MFENIYKRNIMTLSEALAEGRRWACCEEFN